MIWLRYDWVLKLPVNPNELKIDKDDSINSIYSRVHPIPVTSESFLHALPLIRGLFNLPSWIAEKKSINPYLLPEYTLFVIGLYQILSPYVLNYPSWHNNVSNPFCNANKGIWSLRTLRTKRPLLLKYIFCAICRGCFLFFPKLATLVRKRGDLIHSLHETMHIPAE